VDVVIVRRYRPADPQPDRTGTPLRRPASARRAAVRPIPAGTGPVPPPSGAYYGGMETLAGRGWEARSRVRGSAKPRTARRARAGGPAGASGGSAIPASTPTRTSRTTRSGTSCGRTSTTGRGRGDPGRGHATAGARGIGRLDRAGLDPRGHQAGSRQTVWPTSNRRHADLAPAGRPAGMGRARSTPPRNGRRSSTPDTHERLIRLARSRTTRRINLSSRPNWPDREPPCGPAAGRGRNEPASLDLRVEDPARDSRSVLRRRRSARTGRHIPAHTWFA